MSSKITPVVSVVPAIGDTPRAFFGSLGNKVEADFVAREAVDDAEAERLRVEAVRIAMLDPSKEATLARQYEVAAERGFYRAIKQLRQLELQADALLKAEKEAEVNAMVDSFIAAQKAA